MTIAYCINCDFTQRFDTAEAATKAQSYHRRRTGHQQSYSIGEELLLRLTYCLNGRDIAGDEGDAVPVIEGNVIDHRRVR